MSSEDAKVVEAEVVDRDGIPVDSVIDDTSDTTWSRSDKSGRATLRRLLARLAPDWSRADPSEIPAYVRLTPSLKSHIHLELPNAPSQLPRAERRRVCDEICDRLLHIMIHGSDEMAVKAAKMIFDHVDPPMTKSLSVEATGSKILILPKEVAEQV